MCFSAEASFIVGVALIPAGGYCLWASVRKKPSYLAFATVPLFLGIQQIGEGFVWLAIRNDDARQMQTASLFFLFFAQAFWPFWFPVLATIMEPEPKRRWLLAGISLLAVSWFWILYYPLLVDTSLLTIRRDHHSIQYEYPALTVYTYIPRWLLRILYCLSVALPLLLSSQKWGRLPGIVLGVSALLAALLFNQAFVSVWCFFAAIMSGYLCWVLHQFPTPVTEEIAAEATPGK